MRRNLWIAALAAIFVFAGTGWSRQASQYQGQNQTQNQAQSQGQDQAAQTSPPQQESVADAARRAREQKKDEPKTTKVFTNEDLPTNAVISLDGSTSTSSPAATTATASNKAPAGNDEKMWREKFAKLNHQLQQDQSELDVLQRELGVLVTQFYNGNPVAGMQQGMTQADVTAKTEKIDAKKKDIEADKQAIADAEADLQKAGGDPGWER
jgi:cell division protein FtsL